MVFTHETKGANWLSLSSIDLHACMLAARSCCMAHASPCCRPLIAAARHLPGRLASHPPSSPARRQQQQQHTTPTPPPTAAAAACHLCARSSLPTCWGVTCCSGTSSSCSGSAQSPSRSPSTPTAEAAGAGVGSGVMTPQGCWQIHSRATCTRCGLEHCCRYWVHTAHALPPATCCVLPQSPSAALSLLALAIPQQHTPSRPARHPGS